MSVCLDIFSLQRCWEIVDSLFCQVDRGNRCFSRLFQHETVFQDKWATCFIQSQTHREQRRDSAKDKDVTKHAKTRKYLSKQERKKKRKDEEVV